MTARRTDNNHAEIRDGLREAGYVVFDTHELGNGFPDLVAVSKSRPPQVVMLEVKFGSGKLTEDEKRFEAALPEGTPYRIVRSLDAALAALGYYDRWSEPVREGGKE